MVPKCTMFLERMRPRCLSNNNNKIAQSNLATGCTARTIFYRDGEIFNVTPDCISSCPIRWFMIFSIQLHIPSKVPFHIGVSPSYSQLLGPTRFHATPKTSSYYFSHLSISVSLLLQYGSGILKRLNCDNVSLLSNPNSI